MYRSSSLSMKPILSRSACSMGHRVRRARGARAVLMVEDESIRLARLHSSENGRVLARVGVDGNSDEPM